MEKWILARKSCVFFRVTLSGPPSSPAPCSCLCPAPTQRQHCVLFRVLLLFTADEQILLFNRESYGWIWKDGMIWSGWSCFELL